MCKLKSLFICMLVAGMLLSRSPSVKADAPPPADITTEDSRQVDG